MKSFVKHVFATILGLFLALGVMVGVAALIAAKQEEPKLAGILTLDLSTGITDRGGSPPILERVQGKESFETPLRRVIAALRHAAKDDAIKGLLLHGGVGGGSALLRELRLALLEFKKSGKRMVTWFPGYGEKEYYLASAGDEMLIAPLGDVSLDGFQAEVLYYKGALTKFGIDVQVTRVGKYKSAVEPYFANEMSESNREQLAAMLGDIQGTMFGEVAASRAISSDRLAEVTRDTPILTADRAVEAKLVDRVVAFPDLVDELSRLGGRDDSANTFVQVDMQTYAKHALKEHDETDRIVGVVYAEGEIVDGGTESGVGGDAVAKKLRAMRLDPKVKAVVLRVNSPGGSASASEVILDEVRRLRAAGKPVVASMGDLAASGGYWISSLTDLIIAHPSTITGSIGVFGMLPNVEKALADVGVRREIVKTGPSADAGSFLRAKTDAELTQIQTTVDAIYDAFLERVSSGRKMTRDAVHAIAQGRVWTGKAALELGLVDRLGSLDDALAAAAEKAGLGSEYSVRYAEKKAPKIDALLSKFTDGGDPLAELPAMPAALADVVDAAKLASRSGVLVRMPFVLRIE